MARTCFAFWYKRHAMFLSKSGCAAVGLLHVYCSSAGQNISSGRKDTSVLVAAEGDASKSTG